MNPSKRCLPQPAARPRERARISVPQPRGESSWTSISTRMRRRPRPASPAAAPSRHDEVMRLFEEFKAANDERLAAGRAARRRRRHRGEGRAHQRRARRARLDELTLKSARPALGAERARRRARTRVEHKAAFDAYMRAGESAGLRALEVKAMSVGSNPDGGYIVPVEIEQAIGRGSPRSRRSAASPASATISGNVYKKPFMTAGPAVGWVGETDARTQTDVADARRAVVPGDGALRHAGGDRDAARGRRRQHRRVARRRGRAGLRRAGGHGLRHRRRHQQAEGLPRLHHRREGVVGLGQASATSRPARPARSRRAIRPTCWST